jgi:hypothetical protein
LSARGRKEGDGFMGGGRRKKKRKRKKNSGKNKNTLRGWKEKKERLLKEIANSKPG